MSKKYRYEVATILLALLGVVVGVYFPMIAKNLSFIGDIFILLLKMMIVPLVVTSIFLSIATLKSSDLFQLGGKTIGYYVLTSSLACLTGLIIANSYSFSTGLEFAGFEQYDPEKLNHVSFHSLITSFFSGNFFNALSQGNIVQIVVFTILVALASLSAKEKHRNFLIDFSESVQDIMMVLIQWIVKVAPLGIFSLIASIVMKTELKIFYGLGPLFVAITLAVCIHTLLTLPLIAYFLGRFHPYKFLYRVRRAILIALTTASSTATLPISTAVLNENNEVKEKTSGFILPLGATLNMDGSALYQAMVIIFLGEFSGMTLAVSDQLLIFAFVMTSSAGTAGIPGGGIMMMGAVMEMVGIPLENIGIYLLIDRFWDYIITAVNVSGDLIGAKTVDRFIED